MENAIDKQLYKDVVEDAKEKFEDGKFVACGENNKESKACRPTVRINKDTPITLQELLELHSVKDIIKAAEKKNRDMEGRLYWKDLKFIPSKK